MDEQSQTQIWKFVRKFGNDGKVMFVWAVIGVCCSSLAAGILFKNNRFIGVIIFCTLILSILFYGAAWSIRSKPWMRDRRTCIETSFINISVSIVILVIVDFREDMISLDWIKVSILVAVWIFVLMEMAKPIFDFGILPFFLRLPLKLEHDHIGLHFSRYYFIIIALNLFCVNWHSYYLGLFNELYKEKKAEERARAEMEANAYQERIG